MQNLMFDKLKLKRLQQIDTESNTYNNLYPLIVKMSPLKLSSEIEKWLKDEHFEDIKAYSQYLEIFAKRGFDEYTFKITMTENGQSILDVFLFNPSQKNHVYKELPITIESLKQHLGFLADYYIE